MIDQVRSLFKRSRAKESEEPQPEEEDQSGEPELLDRLQEFHLATIDDIKVPRAEIVAVELSTPLHEVLEVFRTAGHSRLPVYCETLDDPRGMVHIRDVLEYMMSHPLAVRPGAGTGGDTHPGFDLSVSLESTGIVRPVLFVPPSMPASRLVAQMRSLRTHMALVIDEYGGTDGLVSLEDLVELFIGEIEDEHDREIEPEIRRLEDGLLVEARAELEDVFEEIGAPVPEAGEIAEIETIGGYVIALAGRLPRTGESFTGAGGLRFEIVDADPRRLQQIRIHRPAGGARDRT